MRRENAWFLAMCWAWAAREGGPRSFRQSGLLTTPTVRPTAISPPPAPPGDVGAAVEVEDEEGAMHVFEIVGEDEADIQHHKVSWVSPLAKALIGHKVGDSVIWRRPAGDLALDIINIRYLQ